MKKFAYRLFTSFVIVALWRLALQGFTYLLSGSPPDIQFPYYPSDLASFYSRLQSVWAHFDGIHYLRIAARGYADNGSQAFFPLYPLLVRFLTPLFLSPLAAGTFISLASLVLTLTGLQYLFPRRTSRFAILSLLLFPTSFFLAAVYSESLFLMHTVWFFVMLKSRRFALAALIAGFASGTRIIGAVLAFSLLVELLQLNYPRLKLILFSLLSLSGLLAYLAYLYLTLGDPLYFFHVQPLFGASRTGGQLVLLPQVLWRYLKIFWTVDPHSLLFQRAALELSSLILVGWGTLRSWHSRRLSLNLYLTLSVLIPPLSGTLLSFPRFILVLVPWLFIKKPAPSFPLLAIFLILQLWLFALFVRGWFVA